MACPSELSSECKYMSARFHTDNDHLAIESGRAIWPFLIQQDLCSHFLIHQFRLQELIIKYALCPESFILNHRRDLMTRGFSRLASLSGADGDADEEAVDNEPLLRDKYGC